MRAPLVTGAGGFIGAHLCRRLEGCGVAPRRVTSRPGSGACRLDADDAALARALEGADVAYFLAGIAHEAAAMGDAALMHRINVAAPLRWLRAADRAGVSRFVWLSSIKVLGDASAEPLRPDDPYRPGDAYACSKVAGEQRLLAEPLRSIRLTVVRPPLVYGPGVRGNFAALLRVAATGMPLPLAGATAPRSLVSVANLCDLLLRLGEPGAAADGLHHAADTEDLTVASLVRAVRAALGQPPRLFRAPPRWLQAGCRLAGREQAYRRLFEPLRVSAEATRTALGWVPPQAPRQAIEETVAWFRTSH